MGLDQNFYRVKSNEIGYLRKANQIRNWLVRHEIIEDDDNCVTRRINKEQLEELLKDINTVLNDHSKARDILPLCNGGFFFGTYDDEENYIQETEKQIFTNPIHYQAFNIFL